MLLRHIDLFSPPLLFLKAKTSYVAIFNFFISIGFYMIISIQLD